MNHSSMDRRKRWSALAVLCFGVLMIVLAGGRLWFGRAPVAGHYLVDVLPGMLLLGLGTCIAFNPVLLLRVSAGAASRQESSLSITP